MTGRLVALLLSAVATPLGATAFLAIPATVPPVLTKVTPTTLVNATLPQTITVEGANLESVAMATVGSSPTVILSQSATQLTLEVNPGLTIGSHPVAVFGLSGPSNTVPLAVQGAHPSVLVPPITHTTRSTWSYSTWTDAGWNALYLISGVNGPTALPGVVAFEIGGGSFSNIVAVMGATADASGFAEISLTMPAGFPTPFTLYWEVLTIDPSVPLGLQAPLETSNSAAVSTLL